MRTVLYTNLIIPYGFRAVASCCCTSSSFQHFTVLLAIVYPPVFTQFALCIFLRSGDFESCTVTPPRSDDLRAEPPSHC